MKLSYTISLLSILAAFSAQGKGLYYVPNDSEESLPIKWGVGMNTIWDDNTTPATLSPDDETFSVNSYVDMKYISGSPQTVWDVYAKLGVLYYLDEPVAAGSDDAYGQMQLGVNLTHSFDERLRLVSSNYVSYELEPDYSYGVATNRQASEYIYWDINNSLGYRWSERLATNTGLQVTMLDYANTPDADRLTWTLHNQFRYVLSAQTVGTTSIRYAQTTADGNASDSTDTYLLLGAEHRFTPNTILIGNAGAQIRQVDSVDGNDTTTPYMELTLRTQVNEQFTVSAFLRYGAEVYDTVVSLPALAEFDSRLTLRVGTQANYRVSQKLALFSDINFISTSYEEGRTVPGGSSVGDREETLFNANIGATLEITEYLDGTISYNFTNADSDIPNRSYDRNRISVGLKANF